MVLGAGTSHCDIGNGAGGAFDLLRAQAAQVISHRGTVFCNRYRLSVYRTGGADRPLFGNRNQHWMVGSGADGVLYRRYCHRHPSLTQKITQCSAQEIAFLKDCMGQGRIKDLYGKKG